MRDLVMASLGEKLRKARLESGLDLREVSRRTKIGTRYLEAIEKDDRNSLPGGFFYRNWVQQYASAVSMDVNAIAAELDELVAQDREPALPGQDAMILPKQMRPAPMTMNGQQRGGHKFLYSLAVLVMVMLGCSGLYAWWHNAQVSLAAAEPERTVTTKPLETTQAPATVPPTAAAPVEPSTTVEAESLNHAVASGAAARTAPEPAADPEQMRIEIAAIQATWLSVAPDGKETFSGVLQPDEVRTVEAHDKARIKVGNAGGLSIKLNGKPIGPIGAMGQVRTVIFDRTGFRIIDPRPAATAEAGEGALSDRAPVSAALSQ
jgi:cytoskeletal protein RodZ